MFQEYSTVRHHQVTNEKYKNKEDIRSKLVLTYLGYPLENYPKYVTVSRDQKSSNQYFD